VEDRPIRVLLIGRPRDHPPKSHEYMAECGLLARCLRQNPAVETTVSDGWPKDPAVRENVDVIALYTAVGGNVLGSRECRDQVEAMLERGVGLVAVHWSTGADVGELGDWWTKQLGGFANLAFTKIPVHEGLIRQLDKQHPISRGWADFRMTDEYYLGLKLNPESRPIIGTTHEGADYPLAWTLERSGGGRSFGFVCGHFHDCFANESFRRVVVNGILWAAKRDVPEKGARVDIKAADLVLPPDPREKP
jgi:type 1 glutamine amidotransferase